MYFAGDISRSLASRTDPLSLPLFSSAVCGRNARIARARDVIDLFRAFYRITRFFLLSISFIFPLVYLIVATGKANNAATFACK